MIRTGKWQRLVTPLVIIGVLVQLLAPALTGPARAASPGAATGVASSTTARSATAALNAAPAANQPAGLAQPLSVARVQSSFTDLGSNVVVTYTLKNTLTPQNPPAIPSGATITDSIAALAGFDIEADPHTLRNVILVAAPTANSAIVATSRPADADGGKFVFVLDNLPPQASAIVVVTATTPASVAAATPLIDATGWASLGGKAVSAAGAPALVLPPAFGDWLIDTLDADIDDADMLQALGQIGGDATAIFAYVRNLSFEAYRGSLRGTRATLWSAAGNSLDQSSLLIAMLRASGIPARYRHGSLSQSDAQTLIASMFPAPTSLLGAVGSGIPISDPVNDAALIVEVQDHWWVEANIGGAWTNLDPSFANAAIGQQFASSTAGDGSDRIAELTDAYRPKVTVKLNVESWSQLNFSAQTKVDTRLNHTFRVVEIAASPVTFSNLVDEQNQGGLVFTNRILTYSPYLFFNDQFVYGDPFQEIITNFPLATTFITGAWLVFELREIDGSVTTFERTLRDRLGYDIRTYGGSPNIVLGSDSDPVFDALDVYSISFFPGMVSEAALQAKNASLTGVLAELAADTERMQELSALGSLNAQQQVEVNQIRARYQFNLGLFLELMSMSFAEVADRASAQSQEGFLVKAYHDDPRLVIISHEVISDTMQFNVDLRTTLERTIAYPGQGEPATFGFNLFKGINESWLEGEVLGAVGDESALTSARVMQAASEQSIDYVFIGADNLDLLATIPLSDEAVARITAAALAGKIVNIPTAAPLIDGKPAIGWWEIDPATGETIGVMENGLHNAFLEFFANLLFSTTVGRLTDFMIGATGATWDFVLKHFNKAVGAAAVGTPSKDALSKMNQGLGCLMQDVLSCINVSKGYLEYGYMAMEAYLNTRVAGDPPLPELLLGGTPAATAQTTATIVLNTPATLSAGSIAADLQTNFVQLADAGSLSFYAAALDPLASGASAGATAVNHDSATSLARSGAELQIAAPSGSATLNGQPLALGDSLAVADFTGSLAINAITPTTDSVALQGSGNLFTLALSPASSTIAPVATAAFHVDLATSFNNLFTVTVSAPEGWNVAIDNGGNATITPQPGATVGAYTIAVTAQSTTHPALILSAEHTVTIIQHNGFALNLMPDPLITVPMGVKRDNRGFINTGQAQVPGAAYLIDVTNIGNAPRNYTINVGGLPGGWSLLGGARSTSTTLRLPAGARGQIGLYVAPDSLPAAGSTHTINVTVTDDSNISQSDSEIFVMPSVPFSFVEVAPASQPVTTTGSVGYDVTVTNVGNAQGVFGVTAQADNFDGTVSFGAIAPAASIPAGGSVTTPVTVLTNDTPERRTVKLFFASPVANTIYTPTAIADLVVVSAESAAVVAAANRCDLPSAYYSSLLSLAVAIDELAYWCEEGDCPLVLRDRVVSAGQSVADYAASAASPFDLPTLPALSATLADLNTQTSDDAILSGVAALGAAVYDLSGDSCQVEQHGFTGRFTPYVQAILLGDTAHFSLTVTNEGSLATTYAITVTGLPGGDQSFNETISPGGSVNRPIDVSPAALGVYNLAATIAPVGAGVTLPMSRTAVARLNVVDKFVQVLAVTADPPFVETGVSSTTVSVDVANPSGVAQAANARTTILALGGSTQFTDDTPLTVLAGNPRTYPLTNVNTSGWTAGVYTITVNLLNAAGALIPDGYGYGYLSVGQALAISQAVTPDLVAPGAVTVTTIITSALTTTATFGAAANLSVGATMVSPPQLGGDALLASASDAPIAAAQEQSDELTVIEPVGIASPAVTSVNPGASGDLPAGGDAAVGASFAAKTVFLPVVINEAASNVAAPESEPVLLAASVFANSPGFTRLEQNDPAFKFSATWTNVTLGRASGGSYLRNSTANVTATLAFTGAWVSVGFIAGTASGLAELFIDGASQGVIDLYRNEETPVSFRYDGLSNSAHTLTVKVLGSKNSLSSNTRVQLDYVDYGDGSALANGAFEQSDSRVILSDGWTPVSYAAASNGGYIRATAAAAWLPFSGDSFSLQALAYNSAGWTQLSVDGHELDRIDLYHPIGSSSAITRTFSYNGFGPGPHVLQVTTYRDNATIDKFTTPGVVPFIDPNPPLSGVTRYEEDYPAIRYNGVPFTQTAQSWTRQVGMLRASGGQHVYSLTANDMVSFDFDGEWIGVGFTTDRFGGQAQIAIDGALVASIDLYARYDDTASYYFDSLGAGSHTITVTVLGTKNPNSSNSRVHLDFFDVWDGQPLADGTFQEDNVRVQYGEPWGRTTSAAASGGAYASSGNSTAWFPFTGDSVTYQAWTSPNYHSVEVRVDGVSQGKLDLFSLQQMTRTYSFDGLGSGPHVLEVRQYRDNASLDAFITPAIGPGYQPPALPAIARYEEDDPAIRYNGAPFTQTTQNWVRANAVQASDGQHAYSPTGGDTVSFDFAGEWIGVGFTTNTSGGQAQIAIDGALVASVDLYARYDNTASYYFDSLGAGSHTITVTVLGTKNANSSNTRVHLDFFDVWDGQSLTDGTFQEDSSRVLYGDPWGRTTIAGASGGAYASTVNSSAWFPFTGDSVTYQAWAAPGFHSVEVHLDGILKGRLSTYSATAGTRPYSFDGLGAGPHVLEIRQYRDNASLDAFITPAIGPGYQPPVQSAIFRIEEDDPAIRYNGQPFTRTAQSWVRTVTARVSDAQVIYSQTANDTVSFDFTGSWIGVGFATDVRGGQAQIAIDGAVVANVDLYTRLDDTASYYFDGLSSGSHTITVTVLGTFHPNSSNNRVYLDFFDVWDGQLLADGTFQEDNTRVLYGDPWGRTTIAGASGGAYASTVNSSAWFPFTGDSVTYQAWTSGGWDLAEIRIDGASQGRASLYSLEQTTRTFSFDGLGVGPHVLEIRQYRYNASLDALITPAVGPADQPPPAPAIVRYEEDHPDMRYNGYPYRQMPQNWGIDGHWQSSGAVNVVNGVAGAVWGLSFEGSWVNVGFQSSASSGQAEVFIDGVSQGVINTANGVNDAKNFVFPGLITGTHTISVVVVSGTIYPDYMDVWNGGLTSEGWYDLDTEDTSGRVHFSLKGWLGRVANQYAHDGDFIDTFVSSQSNAWFSFTGADLTVLGFNRDGTTLNVVIDGVVYGPFNMTAEYADQPIALHFPNLGDGAHVVQVHIPSRARLDAFNVNPANFTSYTPVIEWRDISPSQPVTTAYGTGMASSIALGDLDGDGVVELVAPSLNGRLYVYRGDGADTGDGDPILWHSDLVGPAAEPALADLDNDGKAEIIVSGRNGTFAFRHDGSLLWSNPAVVSYYPNEKLGWGGPTIGNLDLDPEPEIAIAASDDAVYVLDHEGNILWSDPTGRWPTVPVLADITGDGVLDVVVAQAHTLKVYDFFNGGQLAWSYTLANPSVRSGTFGAPAIADIDGDGAPEIIINWGHRIEALNADGSLLWSYYTNNDLLYRPSPITVADVTGDGEPELITASAISIGFVILEHELMVFDASGALLWQQIVRDNTASASGVAAQDLDGDGVWEILWNGATDGFLVIRGSDGKRLFNEPVTGSGTVLDYPTLGDVDGDGFAEVVVSGREGIFVIGHDQVWGDSRPLWNQHNYHVTNINDDWSTPVDEPNSWQLHNTYRTQTPERTPAPAYQMVFTYTEGSPNVSVLTQTASITLTGAPPTYTWKYRQEWYQSLVTTTFDSQLTNLQPGEARQVSAGVQVAYRLPSGVNFLTLPPLYVTAAGLGELLPATAQVVVGGTVVFTLTLTNLGSMTDTFNITVGGLPTAWLSFPASVQLAPGQAIPVVITVSVPPGADPDVLPLLVDVENGSGGMESLQASLTVFEGVSASITPPSKTTLPGAPVVYTLVITNHESVVRTYALTPSGLMTIDAPASVTVGAGSQETRPITVTSAAAGPQPFNVQVSASSGATASADAVIDVTATARAGLLLAPDPIVTGPGSTAIFTMTVSNLGGQVETFDLQMVLPAGWSASLRGNIGPISSVTLPPFVFNTIDLQLLVTPPAGTGVGDHIVTARAVAQSSGVLAGSDSATVQVSQRGVQVAFVSGPASFDPRGEAVWDVQVTNSGQVADSFSLEAAGTLGQAGSFSANNVSLNPGASQMVQLRVSDLDALAPQSFLLSVAATSQGDARIRDQDTTSVSVTGYQAVEVTWTPETQTVDDSLSTQALLNVTNQGNVNTVFDLSTVVAGAVSSSPLSQVTLSPGSALQMPVTVVAPAAGTYTLNGAAQSNGAGDSALATIVFTNQPPVVNAGPDQNVRVNDMVSFNGSANDPDGDLPLTTAWNFGDGATAAGSLTPTHTYAAAGVYTITLTVTDSHGAVNADSLRVTVVANQPPIVNAGPDQSARVNDAASFSGSASDPDGDLPLAIAWSFGDGATASASLTPSHAYAEAGVYTVTLIVTDSRGAANSDSLIVNVVTNRSPTVDAGPDQNVRVNDVVQFGGSASDPDGDALASIVWSFGDGATASDSLTPSHAYAAAGVYTAMLTVTDSRGALNSDSVTITVASEPVPEEPKLFLPIIVRQ